MSNNVEILFATLVAMQKTQAKIESGEFAETGHLEKGLVSLQEKYDTIHKGLDEDIQKRLTFMNLDGDANTRDLLRSFELAKGEMPEFHEEAVIEQILKEQGHSLDDLEKGRVNIANLQPVRREIRTRDGRVYYKTVYVKKEEMSPTSNRGRRFLAQHEYENSMRVGDKIKAHFLGWSSGTEYMSDKLEIKKIDKTNGFIIAKFTENHKAVKVGGGMGTYEYGPSASHAQGREIKIPLTASKDWSEKMSFMKYEKPAPVGPVKVTSIDQISVGDKVKTKIGGSLQEVEITYIHPRGQFAKVKDSEGNVTRKSLSKLMIAPPKNPADRLLSDKKVAKLRRDGVSINISANPSSSDLAKMQKFNEKFPGYDLDEWATETREVIKQTLGARAAESTSISVSINTDGTFSLSVSNNSPRLQMDRRFSESRGKTGVYHALFKVAPDKQGTGIGKKLFQALYRQYRESGINEISVSANIDVGGYAWGRYGFTCDKSTAESLARRFTAGKTNSKVRGYAITTRDRITAQERLREFYRENPSDARFPVNLLSSIGPDNKAGKVALLGTSWGGKIDLTNQEQRTYFENYIGMAR